MKVTKAGFQRYLQYGIKRKILAYCKASELSFAANRLSAVKADDVICICVFRNEMLRLPYFLKYYRELGVDHFVFIDNCSTDNAQDYLGQFEDCTVLLAKGSYKASHFGLHWVNYLLNKYFCGHWILHVDPDEFLVFPYMDTRNIRALTSYLDGMERKSFNTMLVDCYGKQAVAETVYNEGADPLDLCPWFDPCGYFNFPRWFKGQHISGGVRARVFFKDTPQNAPALQKTPLVRWHSSYRFIESTHFLYPFHLNKLKKNEEYYATGCLLHFKFFSAVQQKVDEELVRQEHWSNSSEFIAYAKKISDPVMLWNEASERYEDWRTLAKHGLLGTGNWF